MSLSEVESIKKFYEGAEVFITGASGFIGKALIEKLLRSCPRIKTIYVLMREKKHKSSAQRAKEIIDSLLFDKLREENPDAFEKIQPIHGDMMQLGLGISELDLEKLKSCSVIFHAAASVRFDDPLKSAILLNTRGTREVCELAKIMPYLRAFVHVSTAYIQPRNMHIDEKLYATDADWRTYIKYAEHLDEDLINVLTKKLTKFAPNTYVFTKHMAEQVCIDYKDECHLPMIIYRPSIVSVCESEPIPGWCDNLNGPLGLTIVVALGINHVMNMAGTNVMNVIPLDICVKGMIISAFKYWKDQQSNPLEELAIPVYNAASVKTVSFNSMTYDMDQYLSRIPPIKAIGAPSITFTSCTPYSWMIRIYKNIIPALIIDGILLATRQKPKIMKTNRVIYNAEISLRYFYTHNFTISNFDFVDLNLIIPPAEKDEFSLTEKLFSNSELYFNGYKHILGVALGQTDQDLEVARKRYPYVYAMSKVINAVTIFLLLKLIHICVF